MTKQTLPIFGTDGVRGIANQYPMTSEMALKLGRAIAYLFRNEHSHHHIVIGKDTRLSGYMIETALASGICSMGGNVMLVGPLPTPAIAFITQGMRADAGVVISASHNNFQDNGIKFFDRHGFKLDHELEAQIEELIASDTIDSFRPTQDAIGKAMRIDDAGGRYVEFLKRTIPKGVMLDGLKIVLDCAHGAAYRVAPATFTELGAHVVAVGVTPDGKNINQGCGSTHPELMSRLVKEHNADLGIALDGDGDRLIMCDEKGEIVDGDTVMSMCALHLKEQGKLNHNTIVATVMSNYGLDVAMKKIGVNVVRTPVGDRNVMIEMRQKGYSLGGEQSGHLIFMDHNTTGDGTLAALQVLTMLRERNVPLSQAKRIFEPFPQVLNNVPVRVRADLNSFPQIAKSIQSANDELKGTGRVVVRYSGTELLVRVMIEGEKLDQIRSMADTISDEISRHLGHQ